MNAVKKNIKSELVTQSNQLVEARYNMGLAEQRLILTMIARIQPDDEDFKPYKISVADLAQSLGVDKNSAYRHCKKTTESLLTRVLKIEEPDGLLQVGWVSSAKYEDGTGLVHLTFDPKLKPYLLQLKSNFTSCRLEMLLSFKSQYSIRVYNLLKQYERIGNREIELDPLRQMLGIRDEYQEYKSFKNRILLPVQAELSDKSDICFDFSEIKYGRKVGAIRFVIKSKNVQPKIPDDNVIKLFDMIPIGHRDRKTIKTAVDLNYHKHGFDYVKINILYCNEKCDKSYAGFLANALKFNWGADWEPNSTNKSITKKIAKSIWERQGFKSEKEYNDHMYNQQMKTYGIVK